jgi:ATP-dependent Clp protease ATP-binding subunit ClpC
VAARVLEASFAVSLEEVRAQVARIVGRGDELTTGQIPFTPRAKKVLELSLREAMSLGHSYIGTEHLLLGLAREGEGVANRILLDFGADSEAVRTAVLRMLSKPGQDEPLRIGGDEALEIEQTLSGIPNVAEAQFPLTTRRGDMLLGGLLLAAGLVIGLILGWAIWA